jgi:hypothetical protein
MPWNSSSSWSWTRKQEESKSRGSALRDLLTSSVPTALADLVLDYERSFGGHCVQTEALDPACVELLSLDVGLFGVKAEGWTVPVGDAGPLETSNRIFLANGRVAAHELSGLVQVGSIALGELWPGIRTSPCVLCNFSRCMDTLGWNYEVGACHFLETEAVGVSTDGEVSVFRYEGRCSRGTECLFRLDRRARAVASVVSNEHVVVLCEKGENSRWRRRKAAPSSVLLVLDRARGQLHEVRLAVLSVRKLVLLPEDLVMLCDADLYVMNLEERQPRRLDRPAGWILDAARTRSGSLCLLRRGHVETWA